MATMTHDRILRWILLISGLRLIFLFRTATALVTPPWRQCALHCLHEHKRSLVVVHGKPSGKGGEELPASRRNASALLTESTWDFYDSVFGEDESMEEDDENRDDDTAYSSFKTIVLDDEWCDDEEVYEEPTTDDDEYLAGAISDPYNEQVQILRRLSQDGPDLQVSNLSFDSTKIASESPYQVVEDLNFLSAQVTYFYLKNEIGMSEDAMWKIMSEAPSALGMRAPGIREKVELLRSSMDLSDDDLQQIIERHPTILHKSAKKNLAPKILFLVRALDLSKADMRHFMLHAPALLSYSRSNLELKIDFLRTVIGCTRTECRKLFLQEPKLWTNSLKTGWIPRIRFWAQEVKIPLALIKRIILGNPRLLMYSLENIRPKVYFFILTLFGNDDRKKSKEFLVRLLKAWPQIMDYHLEHHWLPLTDYMLADDDDEDGLGLTLTEFRQMLLKYPRLCSHSLVKIKSTVQFLENELGMNPLEVRKVLKRAPQVVGLTEERITTKIELLRSKDLGGLTLTQVREVIVKMPTLLLYSVEKNLLPKIRYLQQVCSADCDDIEEVKGAVTYMILKFPTLLGYSLENRIRPRIEDLQQAGVPVSSITVGIPMSQPNFESWLQARQQKEDKKRKERAIQQAAASTVTTTTPAGGGPIVLFQKHEPQSDNRIKFWTRERRPPS